METKIRKTHLERRAFVYLRQSTPYQVESNRVGKNTCLIASD